MDSGLFFPGKLTAYAEGYAPIGLVWYLIHVVGMTWCPQEVPSKSLETLVGHPIPVKDGPIPVLCENHEFLQGFVWPC